MKRRVHFYKNRALAIVICMGILSAMLVGCSEEERQDVTERKTIRLWHYWNQEPNKNMLEEIAEDYNRSQKEVKVEVQYFPDEDFKKRLALSMADGEEPELALVDSSDVKYYHAMQPLTDVTDVIEDAEQYIVQAKESCSVDGRMYGLPVSMNCAALYCNVEMLEQKELKVPATWDELYDAAVKLTEAGPDGRYGFAMPALASEESVYAFLPLLWSSGGTVNQLDSTESMSAFLQLRRLAEAGAMSRQTINLTKGDITEQFIEENVAMIIAGTSIANLIREANPEMKFTMTIPPRNGDGEIVTTIGGEVLVATQGENQQYAKEFIRYMSEKEQIEKCFKQNGELSVREDILEEQTGRSGEMRNAHQILRYARVREFSVEWPYISEVLTDTMEKTITGEEEQHVILQDAAEAVREIEEEHHD